MGIEADHTNNLKKDFSIIVAITLLAFVSRGYGLADWDFVVDEFFTVAKASERYTSFVNPAYYALVLASFKVFGVSEWSARLPAMILGSISIPIFYITWKNTIGRNSAIIGAILIIFSSWHLWYSQFSRFYSGVFFFGSLSYFFYYKSVTTDKSACLIWAIIFNVVGIMFHLTSVMVTASCFLFSVFILFSEKFTLSCFLKKNVKIHLAICTIFALFSLPFLWRIAVSWNATGQAWGYGPAKLTLQIIKYVQLPIAITAFCGLIYMLKKDISGGVFFLIGITIPFIALLVGSVFMSVRPDYMFYAYPLIFVLAGYCCEQVRTALLNHGLTALVVIAVVITCMLPELISHYTGRKSLNIRDVSKFIERVYQPNDKVMSYIIGLDYYMKKQYSKVSQLGYPYDNSVQWEQGFQPYMEGKERLWIILPISRKPLAKDLESWLLKNALLQWRKYAKRYDYTVKGYQVFLVKSN